MPASIFAYGVMRASIISHQQQQQQQYM